jgi:hypothetical protein
MEAGMIGNDKWYLMGAWMAMAVVGAFSIYKVKTSPKVDPTLVHLSSELRSLEHGPVRTAPGPVPHWDWMAYWGPVAEARPADPRGATLTPTLVPHEKPHERVKVLVLPFPVMGSAKADLDGATITWTTEKRAVDLKDWMTAVDAKPSGFAVMRESALGRPEKIADLGPAARSYTDPSTVPHRTYQYWVVLTGLETDRTTDSGASIPVENKPDRPVEASTPTDKRLKLVGGDASHAVFVVETYSRMKKAWVPRTIPTTPGEKVDGTGWSLTGLHFEKFTLTADMLDDDGVVRVLTTRN